MNSFYHTSIYANELTLGGVFRWLWMGPEELVARKKKSICTITGLEFQPILPHLTSKEGKKTRFSSIIDGHWVNQACLCNETSVKILGQWTLGGDSWLAGHLNSTGAEASELKTLLTLALCISSHDCSFVSFMMNCVSKALSWVLWVVLPIYWTWEGIVGLPKFEDSQAEG